jgi:hypothetical protein
MTNFDLKTLLPSLLQVEDRTSMSVSLESRVPLLDHRLVELVTRMSPAMRFQGGDTKRVLREAVRPILPSEVVDRRDKMGFPVPLQEWAAGPLRDFLHDILLSPRARQREVFQPAALERLVAGERRYGRELWGVLCLELWFRAFDEGEALTPPLAAGTGGVRACAFAGARAGRRFCSDCWRSASTCPVSGGALRAPPAPTGFTAGRWTMRPRSAPWHRSTTSSIRRKSRTSAIR